PVARALLPRRGPGIPAVRRNLHLAPAGRALGASHQPSGRRDCAGRTHPQGRLTVMATNQEILGRDDANDLEAILAITNDDVDSVLHVVADNADAIFTWDYEKGARPALTKLYEKAKTSQWNGETDLPWDTDVDIEKVAANAPMDPDTDPVLVAATAPGGPPQNGGGKEGDRMKIEGQNWPMSQFMQGEQGALLCTAKIVETVPWIDAKYYASTRVMDGARHVEVFAKY